MLDCVSRTHNLDRGDFWQLFYLSLCIVIYYVLFPFNWVYDNIYAGYMIMFVCVCISCVYIYSLLSLLGD